jgi:hypothetical protein
VTKVVVKKDMIEFQPDGGGFGTAGDDTSTTVEAKKIEPSDYEQQLEKEISDTTEKDKKRDLQRGLDRELTRREKQNAENQYAAQVASQIKAQKLQGGRMTGGSRLNLRWKWSIPSEELNPESILNLLGEYVDFGGLDAVEIRGRARPPQGAAPAEPAPGGNVASGSPTAQLKRGMRMSKVNSLPGEGKQLSESTAPKGVKTQAVEYLSANRQVEVTYADGPVVRFSISFAGDDSEVREKSWCPKEDSNLHDREATSS